MPFANLPWSDDPPGGTPLSAARGPNRWEAGIAANSAAADALSTTVDALTARPSITQQVRSGTTIERSVIQPVAGDIWFDTTLGYPLWGSGSGWVKWDGTPVTGAGSVNAPQNFTVVTQPDNSITCAWNSVAGATSYKLYETLSPTGVTGATAVTGASVTVTPTTLRTYEYWVTALVAGVESAASNHATTSLPYVTTGGGATTPDSISWTYFEEMSYEMTSTVENSRLDWYSTAVYGYILDILDGRGYTAGIVGFCSGTGDMLAMIQHYVAIKPTSNAMATYVPALTTLASEGQGPTAGSRADALLGTTFKNLWLNLAINDTLFRQAQRDYREENYWRPAYNAAVSDGVQGLGLAILYDISVNHGPGSNPQSFGGIVATARAASRPPSLGGGEAAYISALIDARSAVLTAWGKNPANGRVSMHRALLATGNLKLTTPFSWAVYGSSYILSSRPNLPVEVAPGGGGTQPGTTIPGVPAYDHIVLCFFENHDLSEVNSSSAPYLWGLAQGGARFTNSFGLIHPSEGNYIAMFSGSDQGLTDDSGGNPGLTVPSIWSQLGSGNACRWYSEDKPSNVHVGSSGLWMQWHDAMAYFAGTGAQDLNWTAFPSDFTQLPKVAFVAPNNNNNMHDTDVPTGDRWARSNLDAYAQWAKTHNSLLIITFDESQQSNPNNDIFTAFYGANVLVGSTVTRRVDHYDVLRTIETAYGLPGIGNAIGRSPIVEAFVGVSGPPATGGSPAQLLHLGSSGGYFNLGIGYSTGHIDYPYSDLAAGKTWPPYFMLNAAQNAVQFLVYMNGAKTSTNTNYPRSEMRELVGDGVTKAAWTASAGIHSMEYSFRVNHLQPNKPWCTVGQIHDSLSDAMSMKVKGASTGSLSLMCSIYDIEQATPLLSSYAIGQAAKIKIELNNGTLRIYCNDTLKITSSAMSTKGAEHYFKLGAYAQSSSTFGGFESPTEYASVDIWGLTVVHSPPLVGAVTSTTDGVETAKLLGWGAPIDGDEFEYVGAPDGNKWGMYDGPGHSGNGLRRPSAFNVANGILTCTGDNVSGGTTGGMAFKRDELYCRAEWRIRTYSINPAGAGNKYHPVLIYWPSDDIWPQHGEYDFFETDCESGMFEAFLHIPGNSGSAQEYASKSPVDIQNWHNVAFEWTSSGITGWLDGVQVFKYSGSYIVAPTAMHPTMQLDNFFGSNMNPARFEAMWFRIYTKPT